MLMCQYVPRNNWQQWLQTYQANGQEQPSGDLMLRINWYSFCYLLLQIKDKHQRGHFHEMNQDIIKLDEVVKKQTDI